MFSFRRLSNLIAGAVLLACYDGFVKYTGTGIPCLFRYIFHVQCPGCGVTHMLLALAKGKMQEAFCSHPVIFCALPFLGWILVKYSGSYVMCRTTVWKKWEQIGMVLFLIALIGFGVFRNIV